MANEIELISWAIQNRDQLELEIEHTTWLIDLFPGLTDVAAHIAYQGKIFSGWGFGSTEWIALAKALAEAVERIVLQEHMFATSNGIAAHLTPENAAKAAAFELVERDLFLCHHLTGVPFPPLKADSITSLAHNFSLWLRDRGADMTFYHLGNNGVVCAIDGRRAGFGYSFGSAIKGSLSDSLVSSSIEAGRKVHRVLTGIDPMETLAIDDFHSLESPGFAEHAKLAFDLDYADRVSYLLTGTGSIGLQLPLESITTEPLRIQDTRFIGCPLHFARATSLQAQELYLGAVKPSMLNLKRLSEFAGRELAWKDINLLPHPFD